MKRAQFAVFVASVLVAAGATTFYLTSESAVAHSECNAVISVLESKGATTEERQALRTKLRDCLRSGELKYSDVAALLEF